MDDNREQMMAYFLDLVYENDPEEIESARTEVTLELAIQLSKKYTDLNDWKHRANIVQLIQDHFDDALLPIMEHALGIPDLGDDTGPSTIAIAVCHLKKDFNYFEAVFGSYAYAKKKASEILGRPI
ncbi:MAG TPA: hypothetical protein VK177_16905 [Flavobacteriales bacterium]|nr:hypothetical protein [Flavobacteriales bacterium]